MKRHLLTAAILLAAIVLYAFGFGSGGTMLIALGVLCEVWFWARALGLAPFRPRREQAPAAREPH